MIRTFLLSLVVALIGSTDSVHASVDDSGLGMSGSIELGAFVLADTRSKNRRENRQDDRGRQDNREDRRDCRDEEGAVGKDKRDCKQDARQGKNDKKDKDDKDG